MLGLDFALLVAAVVLVLPLFVDKLAVGCVVLVGTEFVEEYG